MIANGAEQQIVQTSRPKCSKLIQKHKEYRYIDHHSCVALMRSNERDQPDQNQCEFLTPKGQLISKANSKLFL